MARHLPVIPWIAAALKLILRPRYVHVPSAETFPLLFLLLSNVWVSGDVGVDLDVFAFKKCYVFIIEVDGDGENWAEV